MGLFLSSSGLSGFVFGFLKALCPLSAPMARNRKHRDPASFLSLKTCEREGFRVWGLGFRVQGLGFRVKGSGFRV